MSDKGAASSEGPSKRITWPRQGRVAALEPPILGCCSSLPGKEGRATQQRMAASPAPPPQMQPYCLKAGLSAGSRPGPAPARPSSRTSKQRIVGFTQAAPRARPKSNRKKKRNRRERESRQNGNPDGWRTKKRRRRTEAGIGAAGAASAPGACSAPLGLAAARCCCEPSPPLRAAMHGAGCGGPKATPGKPVQDPSRLWTGEQPRGRLVVAARLLRPASSQGVEAAQKIRLSSVNKYKAGPSFTFFKVKLPVPK